MPEGYAADGHVHEVPLPDGSTVMTGPPVGHEEPPAGVEPVPEEAPPAMAMRLPAAPRAKVSAPAAPEADAAQDQVRAATALEAGDASLLPPSGRTIYERMRTSALRVVKGTRREEYASALAWRAIRQKYRLGEYEHAEAPAEAQEGEAQAHEQAAQGLRLVRKSATLSTARANGGGSFVVDVTPHRVSDLSAYSQVVSLPVPIAAGVVVRVGLAKQGRQIIDVRVPRAVVGATDPDMARVEAVGWVRRNWPSVWAVAKHLVRPTTPLTGQEKRSGSAWMRRSKFTLDPTSAKDRIGYAEAYVPWEVDLQGQYATEDEVVRMAHGFMLRRGKIGEMHGRWRMPDGRAPGEVVESFLAREGDPHFVPGAWVVGIKCHPQVWQKIADGTYKGVSIGGRWGAEPVELTAILN